MTHRTFSRNTVLTVAGALVGVGALIWSADRSESEIPDRPAAVTIQLTSIPTAEEPLPEIRVPALELKASESKIHVPSRPLLVLADLAVDEPMDPLPGIMVPELTPRCSSLPRRAAV